MSTETMNGAPVIARFGGVVFVRLPAALRRPIDGCCCPACSKPGAPPPTWDTLAVATTRVKRGQRPAPDSTWTVHMPDPAAAQLASGETLIW